MKASMFGSAMALLMLIPAWATATPAAARLEHLLTQDCGACHGLHLTGGLGEPKGTTPRKQRCWVRRWRCSC
ncbi:hypothetical protein [Pseudomonas rhodesiae]|uniref:hypothetical protein n=1 Tax=Pseudomonas rhodesiae TaxID=76760 RepID=UPI0009E41E9A